MRLLMSINDHLCELFHVGRLDVDNVEGLVGDLHVPQVDAEVVGREVRLAVRVHADRVDVVGVRVGEDAARRRLHHQFHRLQYWNLQRNEELNEGRSFRSLLHAFCVSFRQSLSKKLE